MLTITDSVECPTCAQTIHPSNINEYSKLPCIYIFQCRTVQCPVKKFFKCRICTPSTYLNLTDSRRLRQSILQHTKTKHHQNHLTNPYSNNDSNIRVGSDLFEETVTDVIGGSSFDDAHDVHGSDFNSFSSIDADGECENSHISDCTQDVMNIHESPFTPIAISSNEDYLRVITDSPTPLPNELTDLFDVHQKSYFDACVQHKGHKFITSLAMTRLQNSYHLGEKSTTSLYTLLLSKLCIEISLKQRQILATLLSHGFHSATEPNSKIFVPACANDIRNKILEGKHSVKANLPIPEIVELADGFIYIPMKSTIKHKFCSEHPPNAFLPFSHSVHANTPRGKELLVPTEVIGSISEDHSGHPIFPVKLLPWTDDFEVHSVVKTTGASAHLGFVTIGAVDGDHSGRHTHLLWIGPQKSSTEEAEKMFTAEINEMTKSPFLVYSRKHKCVVDVKPKLYAFLADRPDKSKRLSLLDGGNSHACWSYCGEYLNVIDRAVLCTSCFSKLLKNEDIGSKAASPCDVCFSMDFDLMKYKTGDDFPKDMLPPPPSSQLLPFKKVTIDHLKESCLIGFNSIKNKTWTRKQLMCYLRCQGLNEKYSTCIYANGVNAALLASNSTNSIELEEQRKSDPSSFLLPEFPPLWGIDKYFGVNVFVDCPMHLLFLGTYKALNRIHLPRFFIPISKKSTAIKCINTRLKYITEGVTKHLHQASIGYLPLHPTCGVADMKYGSWLSKNWISHQRITKWIHADLPAYGMKEVNNSDLGKEYCLYSLTELKRWCTSRGVAFSADVDMKKTAPARIWFLNLVSDFIQLFSHFKEDDIFTYIQDKIDPVVYQQVKNMTSVERQQWFNEYVEFQKKHPPEVPPTFNVNSQREDIIDLISLHLCIVSRVMHGCSGRSVGRHVKLYLTIFHRFDKALGDSRNIPSAVRQPNLTTLLNLEPTIDRFGPLRYLWEGGGMGEGSIPKVKQFIYDMKPNFAKNAAASHLRKLALDNLLASAFKDVRAEMANKVDCDQEEHYNRLLKSVTESVEKESNRNGVSDSFIGCDELDEPFSGLDQGGEIAAIYKHHAHDSKSCPIRRSDSVVPVVIDVDSNEVFIVVKDKTLVRVHLSHHNPKQLLDGCFLFSQVLQSATLNWSDKKRGALVCGLMLCHPDYPKHYYVIAMNWMETALSQDRVLFRLPRFRGASYEDGVDEKSAEQFLRTKNNHGNKRYFQETGILNVEV
jgi:hypothetical protein